MKKALLFLLIVLSVAAADVFSAAKEIVVETTGRGAGRDQAVKNALYEAVARAKGVKVGSGQYALGYETAAADIDRQDSKKSIEFDAVSVRAAGTLAVTETEGLIKSYEVISEKKIDDGTYEVNLKVAVYDYESPEKTDKIRLAVMPLQTASPSYHFLDRNIPADDISRRLSQKLSAAFTATNKFSVLDRQYIQDFARERNIVLSPDAPLEEKARLGQVLGTDYMLVGTVSEAQLRLKITAPDAIGQPLREYELDFVFDYSLIVAPTRQLKMAGSVELAMKTDDVKKLVRQWEPSDLDMTELVSNLLSKIADRTIGEISSVVFPVRIAAVTPAGLIILDRGENAVVKDSLMEVVQEGADIIDPYTKESLARTETSVAIIQISDAFPKISYAEVIDGDISKLSEGMLCRAKKAPKEQPVGRKANIEKTPSGGVKLPSD